MMCFGNREDVEAKKSREIDALIHRDEKVMQKVVKLLLLGEHNTDHPKSLRPISLSAKLEIANHGN